MINKSLSMTMWTLFSNNEMLKSLILRSSLSSFFYKERLKAFSLWAEERHEKSKVHKKTRKKNTD
jgi:hypothetical protein